MTVTFPIISASSGDCSGVAKRVQPRSLLNVHVLITSSTELYMNAPLSMFQCMPHCCFCDVEQDGVDVSIYLSKASEVSCVKSICSCCLTFKLKYFASQVFELLFCNQILNSLKCKSLQSLSDELTFCSIMNKDLMFRNQCLKQDLSY